MDFEIITLFPDRFTSFFRSGIIERAIRNGGLNYHLINPRGFGRGKHRQVDDTPYGGGAGMLLCCDILAYGYRETSCRRTVGFSAKGKPFTARKARELAGESGLVLVCGNYEGIDERFFEAYVDEEVSIGDYILQSGESAAQVIIESVLRYVPGVLGNAGSVLDESFEDPNLLEHNHYTRPREFNSGEVALKVPEVLFSGDHGAIAKWKRGEAIFNTYKNRPDLFKRLFLTEEEEEVLMSRVEVEKGII